MSVRSSPFHANDSNDKSRNYCISYAQSTRNPTIHEQQEEIYSSLKKVRTSDEISGSNPNNLLPVLDKHVTMIPLGSPHELHRESNLNGTIIRVTKDNGDKLPLKELVPQMRNEEISTLYKKQPEVQPRREFEGWSGRAMEGRVIRGTNKIRGYWEKNIQNEQRTRAEEEKRTQPKKYGFPKWRSTDALSASLVASNCIQIPVDSRIPEERLRKMEETEREAVEVKREIHEEADMMAGVSTRKLSKGKSLDSLNMQLDHRPWYDAEKIKSAVSRESIANIATSREYFETASQRDWRSGANSRRDSMCSLSIAPPIPPKSETIQMRQSVVNSARPMLQNGFGSSQNVLTISSGYDAPTANNGYIQSQTQHIPNSNHHNHSNLQQNQIPHNMTRFDVPASNGHQSSINRLIQQDSPQTADPIEQQEVLLMLYLKQNMDIVQGLGIHIPHDLLAEMDDLQVLPVELRICDEEPHRMFSPVMKNGRYQRKNPQPQVTITNRQIVNGKFVNKKLDPRQEQNEQVRTSRSRQNSEMTNSNLDLSSQNFYHHRDNFPSYGYHH